MKLLLDSLSITGLDLGSETMKFSISVDVQLLDGISDPAGATIERALPALGYEGIDDVSVGKIIRFTLEATDLAEAQKISEKICSSFLTNPVIEEAEISIEELS